MNNLTDYEIEFLQIQEYINSGSLTLSEQKILIQNIIDRQNNKILNLITN